MARLPETEKIRLQSFHSVLPLCSIITSNVDYLTKNPTHEDTREKHHFKLLSFNT